MEESIGSPSRDLEKVLKILDEIKECSNLLGVFLLYRDGRTISQNYKKDFDFKTFAAMCATAVDRAEELSHSIGDRRFKKIIAEVNDHSVYLIECGNKLLLAFLIDEKSKLDPVFNKLVDYIKHITEIYE